MPRVLITGATGQIGSALVTLAPAQYSVHQVARSLQGQSANGQYRADLSDRATVQRLLESIKPDIIINAAAWTNVDAAEQHQEAANTLNAELPRWLAEYTNQQNGLLIHYSTDYVFTGNQSNAYIETDATIPVGVYGQSKLAGEQAILESNDKALILRTSWVYGGPTGNFLDTIAKKLLAGDDLKVVNDQIGCPTWSRDIAACSWQALAQLWPVQQEFNQSVYHLAGTDHGSWYDFAIQIEQGLSHLELLSYNPRITSHVSPCNTDEYPRPAPRPAFSLLNSNRFLQQFGCLPKGWGSVHQCLQTYAKEDKEQIKC